MMSPTEERLGASDAIPAPHTAAAVAGAAPAAGASAPPPRPRKTVAIGIQACSTCCALLGSAAALVDTVARDLPPKWPPRLEGLALASIATSVVLEAAALHCRSRQRGSATDGGCCCASSRMLALELSVRPGRQLKLLVGFAATVLGIFGALGAGAAEHMGIVPRTWSGLLGVFFGCFVHLSWGHCVWNAFAMLLLGPCVLCAASSDQDRRDDCNDVVARFAAASAFIALTSGFCVWCLARPAIHAGASGVVWGYVGLLLALTARQRSVPLGSLVLVLFVAGCYGGATVFSVRAQGLHCFAGDCGLGGTQILYDACTSPTVSAEHHTFGFLSGLASVLFFCRPRLRRPFGYVDTAVDIIGGGCAASNRAG
mmetsp:Transcript_48245/g.140634  ORF Transcript_48245/g.140634 Transcript_48245/m.140634 type:complete len:370 (+) Transcript_48245:100-1209(+)